MAKKKLGSGLSIEDKPQAVTEMDELPPLSWTDDVESGCMTVLACGKNGTGKTHLAGTFPAPRLWLNIDRGTRTVRNLHDPKIDIVGYKNVWMRLLKVLWAIAEKDPPFNKMQPKTIIIDCLTRLSTMMEIEIIDNPPDGKERNETLFLSDYNLIKNRVVKLVNTVKSIVGANLVAVMNVMPEVDGEYGSVDRPAMSGNKIGPEIPNYFDYVLYMHREKDGTFWSNVAPTKRFPWARIRYPGGIPEDFPRSLEGLDYATLKLIDDGKFKPSKNAAQPKDDDDDES